MIWFLLKGLLRDRHRSLFPMIIVSAGVMITILINCWAKNVVGRLKRSGADKTKNVGRLKRSGADKTKNVGRLKRSGADKTKNVVGRLKRSGADKTKNVGRLKRSGADKRELSVPLRLN